MLMIRAIIRPEKAGLVLMEMLSGSFSAVTKLDVYGCGKQKGIKGALNFPENVTLAVNTPAWELIQAPWKTEPTLEGSIGGME